MGFHFVDEKNYKRKEHFSYFSELAYPYVGVTVEVDINSFLKKVREKGYPFFLTFCYFVSKAANDIPAFRQRIKDGRIVEYDRCRTSHTVALDDGTYCYCTLKDDLPLQEYIPYAVEMQERAKQKRTVTDDEGEQNELYFISTLPWLSYSALVQPVPIPADSNPRITWGKYFIREGKVYIPVSVLCHHALVDGRHISLFYERLNFYINGVF